MARLLERRSAVARAALGTAAILDCLGSICSSTALIIVNKHIFNVLRFGQFALLTTSLHFFGGFWLLRTLCAMGWFDAKCHVDLYDIVWVAGWSVASIGLMNKSLNTNSVGMYQVAKLAIIPALLLGDLWRTGCLSVRPRALWALLLLSLGLGIAMVHDISLTALGVQYGAASVIATVVFQVGVQDARQRLGLSAMQLQYKIALPQALFTFIVAVCTEGLPELSFTRENDDIRDGVLTPTVLCWILISVLLAASANYFGFAVVGRFSAITYQVLNHAKTCLVLVIGFALFPVNMKGLILLKHALGLLIGIVGVVCYSATPPRSTPERKDA